VELDALLRSHGFMRVALVLNASNVTVQPDGPQGVDPGDCVALTVRGPGAWADLRWQPGSDATVFDSFGDLGRALDGAGAAFAYARRLDGEGSITAFLPRRQNGAD
jgi:hypothetical protein